MAEIINLRQARKRKAQAVKAEQAAENRVRFGRKKADREFQKAEKKLDDRRLDGHRRGPGSPDED